MIEETTGAGLPAALSQITDPRPRFGRHYPLASVLALAICAVTCDADGLTAIAQWAVDLSEQQLERFGPRRGRFTGRIAVPSEKWASWDDLTLSLREARFLPCGCGVACQGSAHDADYRPVDHRS